MATGHHQPSWAHCPLFDISNHDLRATKGAAMARKTGQGADRCNCAEAAEAAPSWYVPQWQLMQCIELVRYQPLCKATFGTNQHQLPCHNRVTCSGTSMYRHVLWHINVAIRPGAGTQNQAGPR